MTGEYFERKIVGVTTTRFVWQNCRREIHAHDLCSGENFCNFFCPDTTPTSHVKNLDSRMIDRDTDAGLPKFTHSPVNGIHTKPFSFTICQLTPTVNLLIWEKVSVVLITVVPEMSEYLFLRKCGTSSRFDSGRDSFDWLWKLSLIQSTQMNRSRRPEVSPS